MSNNLAFANNESGTKKAERRSSSSATSTAVSSSNLKENKRPLTAVMSEERILTSSKVNSPAVPPVNEPIVRQSYLGKLIRVESGKIGNLQQQNQQQHHQHELKKTDSYHSRMTPTTTLSNQSSAPSVISQALSPSTSSISHGTECDSITTSASLKNLKNDLNRTIKDEKSEEDKNLLNVVDETEKDQSKDTKGGKSKDKKAEIADHDTKIEYKHLEDDDNEVIPLWPSRSEAISRTPTDFIQHKVYSLKDYSQVASPTIASNQAIPSSSMINPCSGTSKTLLKSMSQDRKMKASVKRMSDCSYADPRGSLIGTTVGSTNSPVASVLASSKHLNSAALTVGSSASFSIGSGSITSLLPANTRHAALMGESRIDRVRKLFVSPLSLRSGASKGGASSVQAAAAVNPRLSFQSGASMLNKPHYLMHAMYRTGAGGTHHSRRSPIRPKQGKTFRVYGCPLQMANNIYPITCFGRADIYKQQSVPYVLARLCNYIEENSSQLTHEGIFRVSGNARLMEKLRTLFDRLGDAPLESESVDVATSASMLKMYLRELPEPLIPTRMNYCFIALAKKYSPILTKDNISSYSSSINCGSSSSSSRIGSVASPSTTSITDPSSTHFDTESQAMAERKRQAFARDLTKLLRKLPIENYNLLKYLACFLFRISLKQQYNKMCAEALGIVFGPNVFRIRSESYKGLKEQELSNQIMASIISNYKCIFDSELTDPLGNLVGPEGESILKVAGHSDKTDLDESLLNNIANLKSAHSPSRVLSTSTTIDMNSSIDNSSMDASGSCITSIAVVPPLIASTSKMLIETTAQQPLETNATCCPQHCSSYLFDDDIDDEEEDDDEDEDSEEESGSGIQLHDHDGESIDDEVDDKDFDEEDGNDDEDDDECDDEGESYTPSSGSGSYCSSMDSETLESSFDEDGHHGAGDNADIGSRSNISSSECASNTSYTPTSSHTDSELQEEDIEGSFCASSFGSSPSFNRQADGIKSKSKQPPDSAQAPSCIVCKRRESSQVESYIQIGSGDMRFNTSCDTDSQPALEQVEKGSEVKINSVIIPTVETEPKKKQEVNEMPEDNPKDQQKGISTETAQQLRLPSVRSSSRRRRTESTKKHPISSAAAVISSPSKLDQASSTSSVTSGHVVENANSIESVKKVSQPSIKIRNQELQNKSRHGTKGGQHGTKFDFFRRRSSSASSLTRIKHKRDQLVAAAHKKVNKVEDSSHARSRLACQPPASKHQRRLQDFRTHSSTRRSRGKSNTMRGATHNEPTSSTANDGSSSSRTTVRPSSVRYRGDSSKSSAKSQHRHKLDNYYYYDPVVFDKVTALDLKNRKLAGQNIGDVRADVQEQFLRCDFLSAQYLAEELEYTDRYFLLRSFNSDETLLRSLNYNSDFSFELKANHNRRRFSGHEFDKLSLVQVCHPTRACDQIFEGFEEEVRPVVLECLEEKNQLDSSVLEERNFIDLSNSINVIGQPETSTEAERMFQTSFVSLLDNKVAGFRKSELSINYDSLVQYQVDPVLLQMKSIKSLVKVLKKQAKLCSYLTYSEETQKLLLESSSVPSTYLNDCSTSHIDYLTADSLTEYLEKLVCPSSSTAELLVDEKLNSLKDILQSKIITHRKRFNDLKNIRDHYNRNHRFQLYRFANQPHDLEDSSRKLSDTVDTSTQDPKINKSKIHGSLDTLRQTNIIINSSSTRRQRKLSVPSQDAADDGENKEETSERVLDDNCPLDSDNNESIKHQNQPDSSNELQEKQNLLQDSSPTSSTTFVNKQLKSVCRFGTFCPVEFVFNIEKQLALKRTKGGRLVKLGDMSIEQLQSEKLELQKNLLRYEHWYGRPVTRLEYSLVGHLYERYKAVKMIKAQKQQLHREEKKESTITGATANEETSKE